MISTLTSKQRWLLIIMGALLLLSVVAMHPLGRELSHIYHYSAFQNELHKKEHLAEDAIRQLHKTLHIDPSFKSIIGKQYYQDLAQKHDIALLVYHNGVPIFWNDPTLSSIYLPLQSLNKVFIKEKNRISLVHVESQGDYQMVSYIKIRDQFSSTNDILQNSYAKGFKLPSSVVCRVYPLHSVPPYSIFSHNSDYLFSLDFSMQTSFFYRDLIANIMGLVMMLLGLYIIWLLPLHIWIKRVAPLCLLALIYLLEIPQPLFRSDIFSPQLYASSLLFISLGDLLFISISFSYLVVLAVHLTQHRAYYIATRWIRYLYAAAIHLILLLMIWALGWLQQDLVANSVFEFIPSHWSGWGLYNVITYLILFLLSMSIFLLYMRMLKVLIARPLNTIYTTVAAMAATLFFATFISFIISEAMSQRETQKLGAIAELMAVKLSFDSDPYGMLLLQEMDRVLVQDTTLAQMITDDKPDGEDILDHLRQYYFGGYWSGYSVRFALFEDDMLRVTNMEPTVANVPYLNQMLREYGKHIATTHFSYLTFSPVPGFLGYFRTDTHKLYIYLSAVAGGRINSYSALLADTRTDLMGALNINYSIARYIKGKLITKSGSYDYPIMDEWSSEASHQTLVQIRRGGYNHHIYTTTNPTITLVLSTPIQTGRSFIVLFTYLLIIFLLSVFGLYELYVRVVLRQRGSTSLLSRFQRWFAFILLISFISIGIFSISFYLQMNQSEMESQLRIKSSMLKKNIESYFMHRDSKDNPINNIDFFLQEMSSRYNLDIHLYSMDGALLSSSMPLLFSRSIIGTQISPEAISTLKQGLGIYVCQESIGTLTYYSSYMILRNSKNKPMAYLNIPWYVSNRKMEEDAVHFMLMLIDIYILILLIALTANLYMVRRVAKPLEQIGERLDEIALTGDNQRMEYRYNDELGKLVSRYNEMLEKLDQSAKLLAESEREGAWKLMAQQIAHEINNPLTPMRLTIQQLPLRKQRDPEGFDAYLARSTQLLIEQIDHLSQTATSFSKFSKLPDAQPERCDIVGLLESTLRLYMENNQCCQFVCHYDTQSPIWVMVDRDQISRVFSNLLKNALQAIPADREGRIELGVEISDRQLYISIQDNGVGIDPEIGSKLFVPQFTTKSSGMGLGLAIVKHHIMQSKGQIRFEPALGGGTRFIITLPLE